MSSGKNTDPAMLGASGWDRRPSDRYWTEPWCTEALLRAVNDHVCHDGIDSYLRGRMLWEPSAGRGDMVGVLVDAGCTVIASDRDMSEFVVKDGVACLPLTHDFLSDDLDWELQAQLGGIVMNPPYGADATRFIRKALEYDVGVVATLMRSEYLHASGKRDGRNEFFEDPRFAFEVVLTSRPRWDEWWIKDEPDNAPRHNFSWFVWVRDWEGAMPGLVFQKKE